MRAMNAKQTSAVRAPALRVWNGDSVSSSSLRR